MVNNQVLGNATPLAPMVTLLWTENRITFARIGFCLALTLELAKVLQRLSLISAVMLKIAEMEYSGANSIFLRIFFDKKYAMPYRVVDAVVFHFLR